MPSYFFHLDFELYPTPSSFSARDDSWSHLYLPPPDTNLFTSPLPSHSFSSPSQDCALGRSRTLGTSSITFEGAETQHEDHHAERRWTSADDCANVSTLITLQPPNRGDPLRADPPRRTSSQDWRFGPVAVESVDMTTVATNAVAAGTAGFASKGKFVPSDAKNTNFGWGVVHLYRDGEETPGLYDDFGERDASDVPPKGTPSSSKSKELKLKDVEDRDCTTLCILAVPSYLTPSDFLGFVGSKTREAVSHFRMIRTGRVNRYMVLMKFRDAKKAREWRREWNGKAFNTMEPENCHVVFIKSIEFRSHGLDSTSYPDITNDPFSPNASHDTATVSVEPKKSVLPSPSTLASATPLSTKPLAPPTPSLMELPTCPVCLERMDETTGLLTILCQHVFHCACLQKWRGSGCPVCRYTQGDGVGGSHRSNHAEGDEKRNVCSVCRSEANLWICLICGNIGCGRYDEAHAFSHYEETSHSYAMDIDTQRVWDYAGDGYVHRLIQNKSDGKLVELPSTLNGARGIASSEDSFGGDGVPREKLENIGMEYTHLLTSQLESQRLYFEEKIAQAADKASEASQAADAAAATTFDATKALERVRESYDKVTQEIIPALEREKSRAERKADKFSDMARKMEKEWKEEKTMNASLMERIEFTNNELRSLKLRNEDLEEQNRDLSFFISGQQKLDGLGDEIQEGTLSVGEALGQSKKKKGKGKR
ncbi:MAG: hypothetical protein M1833_004530 [Piccolia ochrophora]|nr:MAG: hypothetical protein M1833_004530 [Piccolia ochrophora]